MEEGLRRKAGSRALIVHLPTKSARDAIRYYMIHLFPRNGFLVQKINTLFKVIYQRFFLNTLNHVTKKPVPSQPYGFGATAGRKALRGGDRGS